MTVFLFSVPSMVLAYNLSNRAVALLCNHKKTASKNFDDQMARQDEKIAQKEEKIEEAQEAYDNASSRAVSIIPCFKYDVNATSTYMYSD